MAIIKNDFTLQGGFGNLSAYKRQDSDKTFVRTKGGPNKNKIKRGESCEIIRKINVEFGGASQCSKRIRRLLYAINRLVDSTISGRLTSLFKKIQVLDTEQEQGQRNIYISRHRSLLEGFQFNQSIYLETIARQPIFNSISREQLSATVILPDLIPGINFYIPGKYPLFRFIVTLAAMPDMLHGPNKGYVPSCNLTENYTAAFASDWAPTSKNYTGQKVELQLNKEGVLDDTCSLVLAIGIDFGMPVTNELVDVIKHAGSSKLLALG